MAHSFQQQRQLFPALPPELRNEIYTYLSSHQHASAASLPLKLKSFSYRHTAIEICPVHYGAASLLSLQNYNFLEASEYHQHLLQNALEIRVGIVFKGRVNTFVQGDWDNKVKTHLNKLVKQHAWLGKAAKVDVRIRWDPVDGVLRSKNGKRSVGGIVRDMLGCVLRVLNQGVLQRKGHVRVKVEMEHSILVEHVLAKSSLGLGAALHADFGIGPRLVQADVVLVKAKRKEVEKVGHRFVKMEMEKPEDKQLISVAKGAVSWTEEDDEHVVMRRQMKHGRLVDAVFAPVAAGNPDGLILHFLAENCTA